jgi:hypothetical protein
MRNYISSTIFEIVNQAFTYRGWDVRGDHMYKAETPQKITFGDTGIKLSLIEGRPKLEIPSSQKAELITADHVFNKGLRVDGSFLEVQIF